VEALHRRDIKLLIVDPFVSCHELTENSNDEMNFVMSLWADVADQADCAVWLIHHFRKGGASGDAEAFRGAVAIQGKARSMFTMGGMAADEGKDLGIDEKERWRYIRHDNAKQNMAPRSDKAVWYKLVGVDLGNRTDDYPDGDSVHTLEAWTPPSAFEGLDWALAETILRSIDDGRDDGGLFTVGRKGERWAGHVVMDGSGKSETQAKQILEAWNKAGIFKVETYPSPVAARKGRSCPKPWCSNGLAEQGWLLGQAARDGKLTVRSSPIGAMVSSVM
jgi:hypothetical protein